MICGANSIFQCLQFANLIHTRFAGVTLMPNAAVATTTATTPHSIATATVPWQCVLRTPRRFCLWLFQSTNPKYYDSNAIYDLRWLLTAADIFYFDVRCWAAVLCILFQRHVAIPTENHRSNRNSIFSCRFGFHGFLPPATLNWEETYAISVIRCSAYILVRHIIMNNLQLNTLWRWQKWCLPKVARKSNIIQQYM